jgi:hypothetical protein
MTADGQPRGTHQRRQSTLQETQELGAELGGDNTVEERVRSL